jgi:putative NADPH-quinone reductase
LRHIKARTRAPGDTELPPAIAKAQLAIGWAQHLLIVHPLWIGSMPALLKAFFEQALRPGFALSPTPKGGWSKLLSGRRARVVVTMGMPASIYRWYFGAPWLKSLTQNLGLVGVAPCRTTLIWQDRGDERAPAAQVVATPQRAGRPGRMRRQAMGSGPHGAWGTAAEAPGFAAFAPLEPAAHIDPDQGVRH